MDEESNAVRMFIIVVLICTYLYIAKIQLWSQAQEFEGNHVLPVVAPRFVIVQEEEAVVGDNFAHQADANLGEDLNE